MKELENESSRQDATSGRNQQNFLQNSVSSINNSKNKNIDPDFASVIDLSADAIFSKTIDGYIISWNKGAEIIYGYSSDEIIGKHISVLCLPEKHEEIDEIMDKIRSGKYIKNYETFRVNKNGEVINIALTISPIKNDMGTIIAATVIAHNTTQENKIEREASESDRKFQNLFKYAPISIVRTNRKGEILSANMAFVNLLGYSSKDEVLKLNVAKDIYFDKKNRKHYLDQFNSGDLINGYDQLLKKKDGSKVWVHLNSHIIRDNKGKELYFENFLSDITYQREAQRILIEQEQSYRSLVESSIDPIYVMQGRRLLLVNPAWTKLFGYTEEEACSPDFDIINIIAPESREEIERKLANYGKTKPSKSKRYEMSGLTKSGKIVHLEVSRADILWKGKNAVQGIYRDITARKKQEELLVRSKEAAEKSDNLKSEFLAQMSHEIRTPLNNILTYASLLKEELEDKIPGDFENIFSVIDNSSHRLIRTIDLILNLSKIQSGNFETNFERIDLVKDILEDIVLEFYPLAKSKNIDLKFENKSRNCLVLGDMYSLNQIFLNLIDNAIKFTEKGGVIITIDNYRNRIRVSIKDTGIGMSKDYQESVFKPFSQENINKNRFYPGIGLGLSLVKKYTEINNAIIEFATQKWKGTTFTILFEEFEKK